MDSITQVHHYLYHGINNTINTSILKVSSDELNSIIFPGNINVALIQGNILLENDKSSSNVNNNDNDVYVCLEQSLESISTILPNAYTIMSISSLVYLSGSKYHKKLQISDLGDLTFNFIPITILLSKILSVIHEVDIPKKLRLSHLVNSSLLYAIQHYPMLSQENKYRDKYNSEDGISFNNKLQELGMTLEEFEQLQQPKYQKCYEIMRGLIPTNIFETTLKTLIQDGLDSDVAGRIWHKRILWLVCMHIDDIKRIHIADLRGKYSFHGLDINEMRAIWYIIPSWEGGNNPKSEWKESFKARLHELSAKEITGTLSDYEEMHPAYLNCDGMVIYDSKAPLKRLYVDNTSNVDTTSSKPSSIIAETSPNPIVNNDNISSVVSVDVSGSESDEKLLKSKLTEARNKKTNPLSKRLTITTKKNRAKDVNKEYGDFLNDTIYEDEQDDVNTRERSTHVKETVGVDVDAEGEDNVKDVANGDESCNKDEDDDDDDDDDDGDYDDEDDDDDYDDDDDEDYDDDDDEDYDDDDDEDYDDDDDGDDVVFGEGVYDYDSENYASSNDEYEDTSNYKRVPITAKATTAFGCIPTSSFGTIQNNNNDNDNYDINDEGTDIGENASVIGSIISSVAVKSTVESTTSNLVYAFKSLIGGGYAEDRRIQEYANQEEEDDYSTDTDRLSPETIIKEHDDRMTFPKLPTMPWNEFWKKVSVARGYLSSVEEETKIESEIDNFIVPEELISPHKSKDDNMSAVESILNYQYADINEVDSFDEFQQFAIDNFWSVSNDEHDELMEDASTGSYHTYVSQNNEEADYMTDVDDIADVSIKINDNDDIDDDNDNDDDFYINSGLKINRSSESLETNLNLARYQSPDTDYEAVIGEIPRDSTHASELLLKCASNPEDIVAPIDTLVKLINTYNADVNAIDESGSTPLHFLFNKSHLGKFLVSRGANILAKDNFGDSPLSLCIEYGYDWMLPSFEAIDGASKFNRAELKEYAILLIHGGYGLRVRDLIDSGSVTITAEEALELMDRFHGNYDGMKEPIETYELLETLALQ